MPEFSRSEIQKFKIYRADGRPLKLSENVTISRGVQDTDNIRSFETYNEDAPYFYLNVSNLYEIHSIFKIFHVNLLIIIGNHALHDDLTANICDGIFHRL